MFRARKVSRCLLKWAIAIVLIYTLQYFYQAGKTIPSIVTNDLTYAAQYSIVSPTANLTENTSMAESLEMNEHRLLFNRPPNSPNMFDSTNKFIIQNFQLCERIFQPYIKNKEIRVLLMVTSMPQNFARRSLIRSNWGSTVLVNGVRFATAFFLGRFSGNDNAWKGQLELLRKEDEKYQDLVVGDFVEAYFNLTYKTILGVTWSHFFCPQAGFTVKIDDDVMMRRERFITYLKKWSPTGLYAGNCIKTGKPHRSKKSKWYITTAEYKPQKFPPFCYGPSYIMSRDVVSNQFFATLVVPFFKLEDVYMGICLTKHNTNVFHVSNISNTAGPYNYCNYRHLFIMHRVLPQHQKMYERDLINQERSGRVCPVKKPPVRKPTVKH